MILPKSCFILAIAVIPTAIGWTPSPLGMSSAKKTSVLFNSYLDNLSRELRGEPQDGSEPELDRESMNLAKEQVDRYGVGDWKGFVDFNEFDGGDGQMGVAGDGSKGLEKSWKKEAHLASSVAKSRDMSAKVSWGKSTGYADELRAKGVETSRAQQLENWMNQQELQKRRNEQRFLTDQFDPLSKDDNWRDLSKFGVERNQEFDMDTTFGAVTPGSTIYHHIQLNGRLNRAEVFEFNLLNSFMGYSDFRARFTPEAGTAWTVEPSEGALNGKTGIDFLVKFRPQNPGTSTGYLVIQTEDDKWTFQVTGTASM